MACPKIVEDIQNYLKAFKSIWRHPKVFEDIQNYLKAFKLYYYACTKTFWKLAIYFEGNQIILIGIKSEVLLKKWHICKCSKIVEYLHSQLFKCIQIYLKASKTIWRHPKLLERLSNYIVLAHIFLFKLMN